jgi:hypothetical protein
MEHRIECGRNGSNCHCVVLSEKVFVGKATHWRDACGPINEVMATSRSRMDNVVWDGESFEYPNRGIVTLVDGELVDFK